MTRLRQVIEEVAARLGGSVDIFRGDGFQVVPVKAEDAFLWAVLIRAGLLARSPARERWDARLAIAFGDLQPGLKDMGDAYVLSGRTLDQMKRRSPAMVVRSANDLLLGCHELATELASALIDTWTSTAAQTYYAHALNGMPDHQSTAKVLGKGRPTVTKALMRAHAHIIDRFIEVSAASIKDLSNAHPADTCF